MKVVSLFDGISCGRIALDRAGYTVFSYHAYEIDKHAKAISRYQYPEIVHCGDVLDADFNKYADIDLVVGGSPCTFWSIAKTDRELDKNGMGWELFMRFVEAARQIRPRFFLLENVASMPCNIKTFISEELGCEPILINSALVSAQKRKRLYWTNIKGISPPDDKGILLKDILDSGISFLDKSYCITATYAGATFEQTLRDKKRTTIAEPIALTEKSKTICSTLLYENAPSMLKRQKMGLLVAHAIDESEKSTQIGRIYSVRDKFVSVMAQSGSGTVTRFYKIDLPDGDYTIRKLTPGEAEKCQTLPEGYTAMGINDKGKTVKISNTQRYRAIGNGFTVDVIAHILSHMNFRG